MTQTIQGQNIRFSIKKEDGTKMYVAAATNGDITVEAQTEDKSTKDSTGGWKQNSVVSKSWSGSIAAKMVKDAAETAAHQGIDLLSMVGETVEVEMDVTNGVMNREKVEGLYGGQAIITSWKLGAPNQQDSTVDISFTGDGPFAPVNNTLQQEGGNSIL